MALPEIPRPGLEAVDYGSRVFTEESKAIGAQLERFEEIRSTAAIALDNDIQNALRSTLSFTDRVKFDIGRIGDANIRALDEVLQQQVAMNVQVTSDAAKFLQDRTIYLTKRLLEADAVEARAIANELSDIREQAKRLADTERDAIDELAAVGSQGLGEVSVLREAFTKALPTAESLVEGALGGGFVGKFAGNIIRVRKARKQRKAALDAEMTARENAEAEGVESFAGVEGAEGEQAVPAPDAMGLASPGGGIDLSRIEELLRCICSATSKTASIIAESLKSDVEKEKEEDRREERIVDALENIEGGGELVEGAGEEKKKKGIFSSIMSGLSMLSTGLRLIKNPKLAFRFFRMKLFRNVISPLKKNFAKIFGKGGMLRNMVSGLGSTFSRLTGSAARMLGISGAATTGASAAAGAVPTTAPTPTSAGASTGASTGASAGGGGGAPKPTSAGAPKPKGFFGRMFGKVKSGISKVKKGVTGAAKFVAGKAKMAKDLLARPVKFLTTKLGPKAVPFLGKIAKKIPIIGSGIEALLTGADIMAIKGNPEMSPKEKKEAIGKRIGAGLGGIIGAVGGGALGTFIPVPVLGSILGAVLGDLAGRYVGDAIAGAIGGEKIYDALSFMLPDVEGAEPAQPSGADGPQADAGTGAGMGGQGSPITAPTPKTSAASDFVRAGTAQNNNMQLAMTTAAAPSVSNAVQSNTAMTTNQFMGGNFKTRNSHDTLDRVSQDRLAYGLA